MLVGASGVVPDVLSRKNNVSFAQLIKVYGKPAEEQARFWNDNRRSEEKLRY